MFGFEAYHLDLNTGLLILIMFVTGVFSGLTAHQWKKDGDEKWYAFVFMSTLATFTVPLFLQTISSNLILPTSSEAEVLPPTNYLVFSSLCLLAGFYAPRYLRRLLDRVLRDVEETKEEARASKVLAKAAQLKAESAFTMAAAEVPEEKLEPEAEREEEPENGK